MDEDTIYLWHLNLVLTTTVTASGIRYIMPFTAIATRYHEGQDFLEALYA